VDKRRRQEAPTTAQAPVPVLTQDALQQVPRRAGLPLALEPPWAPAQALPLRQERPEGEYWN
jgi:hypothetical protein